VSNAALGLRAAGSAAALAVFGADSNVALVYSEAAAEALAVAVAILHLKLPKRELAAPEHWFGASTGQAALNQASTMRSRS